MQTAPLYPNGWGNTIPATNLECVDVSGVYKNTGDDAAHPKRPIDFSFLLYGVKSAVSHIQISQPDKNSVTMSLWDQSHLVARKHYERDRDFTCTNGEIGFFGNTELVGENVVGVMRSRQSLMKTDDGWLVVKQRSWGVGLVFALVPVGGSDIQWYRFKPVGRRGEVE